MLSHFRGKPSWPGLWHELEELARGFESLIFALQVEIPAHPALDSPDFAGAHDEDQV